MLNVKQLKFKFMAQQENFENDTTEYVDCLDSLKKVNSGINIQEVILWFNENDVDYFDMNDLDMYIYYIEKNSGR